MRNPFAGLFTKESAVQSVIVSLMLGRPVYTPVRYDKLAIEGYQSNPYVYACVNVLTKACSGIDWKLKRRIPGKDELIEDHPLLDLWQRPNPAMGGAKFVENLVGFLKLSGNSYIEGVYASERQQPPSELYILRPDRVKVIPANVPGMVSAYRYTAGGHEKDYPYEHVAHLATFSPTDDWYGLSPIQVAARSVDQSNASKDWNVALLQNMARPSGAFVLEGYPSESEFKDVKRRLHDQYEGTFNAGRPLVTGGGVNWQSMGLSPVDMDWLEGQHQSAREIAITFGVSPELIGDSANKTHANYAEARRALYEETVIPDMDWIRDELNNWFTPQYQDDRLYLDYDRDGIEALQADRASTWNMAIRAVRERVLTVEEGREMVGYPRKYPAGETVLEAQGPDTGTELKSWTPESMDDKKALWLRKEASREAWYEPVTKLVEQRFTDEKTALLEQVAGSMTLPGAHIAIEHEMEVQAAEWMALYAGIYTGVAEAFGQETFDDLMGTQKAADPLTDPNATPGAPSVPLGVLGVGFDVAWDGALDDYIKTTSGEKVTGISNTTKRAIKDIVTEGVESGWSIPDLATAIDKLYLDEIIPNRSTVIARTETISASNFGSRLGAKQTGLDLMHEWLATFDKRTRETHMQDILPVPLDEPFQVGASLLMFPGDTSLGASAGEVINCLTGEVLVRAENVELLFVRPYEGEIIELRTSSGGLLSGTPNHPILTPDGWVPLGELQIGQQVIRSIQSQRSFESEPQIEYVPFQFPQSIGSLAIPGVGERIGITNEDFHGDGADSYVDVVALNSQLGNRLESGVLNSGEDFGFPATDHLEAALETESTVGLATTLCRQRNDLSLSRLIRSGGLGTTVNLRSLGEPDTVGFAATANNDTLLAKYATDDIAGEPVVFGKVLLALSTKVTADNIVSLRRTEMVGHVYNLQTRSGHYEAGSIITHNCRCTETYSPMSGSILDY